MMRFLVLVLLLTMFSGSAIAHDDKKWIHLDCKGKWEWQTDINLTLSINMNAKEYSKINASNMTIMKKGSYHNESHIKLRVKVNYHYANRQGYNDWQTIFSINRINGKLFVSNDDLRAGKANGDVFATFQCKQGRMF